MNFFTVPVAPQAFMDDKIHGAKRVEEARRANHKVDIVTKQLNLWLNQDKSVILHIQSMEQNSFARLIYEEQLTSQWPGLAKETGIICQSLNIEDCNTSQLKKKDA